MTVRITIAVAVIGALILYSIGASRLEWATCAFAYAWIIAIVLLVRYNRA